MAGRMNMAIYTRIQNPTVAAFEGLMAVAEILTSRCRGQIGGNMARIELKGIVAQFLGSPTMNIVPVQGHSSGVTLAHGVRLDLAHLPDAPDVAELGIRPEHIDVVEVSDLIGVADVVEYLGSDTNIFLQVDGLGPLMVRKHGNFSVRSGDRIGLRIQPTNVHLFAVEGTALRRATKEQAA